VADLPALAARRASLAASVNRHYAPFDAALSDGDEVVFIPPVSGG
jgi:molybdopterin converting factor small subunit